MDHRHYRFINLLNQAQKAIKALSYREISRIISSKHNIGRYTANPINLFPKWPCNKILKGNPS